MVNKKGLNNSSEEAMQVQDVSRQVRDVQANIPVAMEVQEQGGVNGQEKAQGAGQSEEEGQASGQEEQTSGQDSGDSEGSERSEESSEASSEEGPLVPVSANDRRCRQLLGWFKYMF